MRGGKPVGAQVHLIGGGKEVAGGDGDEPFGADSGGQELAQRGRGRIGDIVDGDHRAAFGGHEEMRHTIEDCKAKPFGFHPL